jgi:hypothetical protein
MFPSIPPPTIFGFYPHRGRRRSVPEVESSFCRGVTDGLITLQVIAKGLGTTMSKLLRGL